MENKANRITPGNITTLKENEIFVFGSNLQGMHGGGAARYANLHFGAVWGVGVGMTGKTYAIPTMQGGVETIKPYVDEFLEFAKEHSEYKFLVTRIGCGIAGFKDADIAPLFAGALELDNVYLPQSFYNELAHKQQIPVYIKKKIYGQTRTLVDLLIGLNKQKHFNSPDEAIPAVMALLNNDDFALNSSLHFLYSYASDCFIDGHLDVERLMQSFEKDFFNNKLAQECMNRFSPVYIPYGEDIQYNCNGHSFWYFIKRRFASGHCNTEKNNHPLDKEYYDHNILAKAYMNYAIEKTIGLIMFMNEFRRYTDASQIIDDIRFVANKNFFAFGHYPLYFFKKYVHEFWREFAPKGVLDNQLLFDFMIGRHERGIKKYGLEAVVRRNYKSAPCHSEALFPYRGGLGPVYSNREYGEKKIRRLVKSCGEGMEEPNMFERNLMIDLIKDDPKYIVYDRFHYEPTIFLPKDDVTLPVYKDGEKMEFDSPEAQEAYIRNIWRFVH